jgi:fructokinase
LRRVLKGTLAHEKKVGGWLNEENGQFYFDSVRIFTNMDKAICLGRKK